jgi:hypothetical protein
MRPACIATSACTDLRTVIPSLAKARMTGSRAATMMQGREHVRWVERSWRVREVRGHHSPGFGLPQLQRVPVARQLRLATGTEQLS